jgi:hypothetical protein
MTANQITVYLDPAQLPARTQDQVTFDAAMAYLVSNFPTFGAQFNAAVAAFNVAAAGGAYAIPYTVDLSSTADADPTSGKLRFNAANQNAATTLFADLVGADTIDYTSILDQFDASTSGTKGQIRIVKQGDPTKFLAFDVTARTTATGYRKLAVTNTGGSSANPFGANEAVLIKFTRTGDKGDSGSLTPVFWAQDQKSTGTPGGDASANGGHTRVFNTVVRNTITGASLSGNQITLPAGTYRIRASAPGYGVGKHKLILTEAVSNIAIAYGPNEYAGTGGQTRAIIGPSEFVFATGKTVYLLHHAELTSTNGLGVTGGWGGETYADIFIEKVS